MYDIALEIVSNENTKNWDKLSIEIEINFIAWQSNSTDNWLSFLRVFEPFHQTIEIFPLPRNEKNLTKATDIDEESHIYFAYNVEYFEHSLINMLLNMLNRYIYLSQQQQ